MDGDDLESSLVHDSCPGCCESRVDRLEWLDEETVRCLSCGREYRPGEESGDTQ